MYVLMSGVFGLGVFAIIFLACGETSSQKKEGTLKRPLTQWVVMTVSWHVKIWCWSSVLHAEFVVLQDSDRILMTATLSSEWELRGTKLSATFLRSWEQVSIASESPVTAFLMWISFRDPFVVIFCRMCWVPHPGSFSGSDIHRQFGIRCETHEGYNKPRGTLGRPYIRVETWQELLW